MWNAVPDTDTGYGAADRPTPQRIYDVVRAVADQLDENVCWLYRRAFHVRLPAPDWTVAIRPEPAGRFRLEACHKTVPRSTVWVLDGDDARLAAVVRDMAYEVAGRTAAYEVEGS